MKEIYKIGGYVRCIKSYDCAKVGNILRITNYGRENSHPNSVHVVNEKGETTLLNTTFDSFPECEWVGMKKPQEIKSSTEEVKIEKWVPRNGEYAVMLKNYGDIKKGMIVKLTKPQGGDNATCWYVDYPERSGTPAPWLTYMRPALPHEIPQQKTETMETYTPQEGDWIVAVSPQNTHGCTLLAGKAYKVKRILYNNPFCTVEATCDGPDIYFKDLRKAHPEEIPHIESEKSLPVKEESMEKASEITKEEVLRRYPKGTKYKGLRDSKTQISEGVITHFNSLDAAVGYDYVYRNGEWADIVEEEQEDLLEEAKRRFPVGTRFGNMRDEVGNECIVTGGHCISGKDVCVKADRPFEKVKDGNTYIYYQGKWAKSPTKYYEGSNTPLTSFSNTIIYMGTPEELKTEWKWNMSSVNTGVEKMPSEIIVKRNKKVGRRLIMV